MHLQPGFPLESSHRDDLLPDKLLTGLERFEFANVSGLDADIALLYLSDLLPLLVTIKWKKLTYPSAILHIGHLLALFLLNVPDGAAVRQRDTV